jgi:hypothetical protein
MPFPRVRPFSYGCIFLTASAQDQIAKERRGAIFRWVIEQQLANGARPRKKKRRSQVPKATVDAWIKKAKGQYGIRSIICLLDPQQLRLYERLPVDLVLPSERVPRRAATINTPHCLSSSLRRFGKPTSDSKSLCSSTTVVPA